MPAASRVSIQFHMISYCSALKSSNFDSASMSKNLLLRREKFVGSLRNSSCIMLQKWSTLIRRLFLIKDLGALIFSATNYKDFEIIWSRVQMPNMESEIWLVLVKSLTECLRRFSQCGRSKWFCGQVYHSGHKINSSLATLGVLLSFGKHKVSTFVSILE